MENFKALKELVEEMTKDAEKAFLDKRKASAKRVRKQTLKLRELINKVRSDALDIYRTPRPDPDAE